MTKNEAMLLHMDNVFLYVEGVIADKIGNWDVVKLIKDAHGIDVTEYDVQLCVKEELLRRGRLKPRRNL